MMISHWLLDYTCVILGNPHRNDDKSHWLLDYTCVILGNPQKW